ncbi:hypothetical protein [Bizionia myxarmorum]|uniref:Lipoprotein n=1 Tax=Bizionia myxarmorum TaxID=291186 RepID=A0A5D0RD88_9FLAO|nr:hypothetical protein [Bizionia myxarmorum]TYB78678.1 hypothetical protein ES674_02540 [Bizionia myxarmorum]
MKYFQLFIFSLFLFSCATKPNIITDKTVIWRLIKNNHCPDDGVCSLEITPNQNLTLEKDGIGVLYPHITEGDKTLLVFEYKRNDIPDTVDGIYRELIYLELNTDNIEVNFEETDLQQVKALFARLCFCRGQTGYYPIKQGTLSIKKLDKNEYSLKMNFKIDEVPQIVNSIDTVFTLN